MNKRYFLGLTGALIKTLQKLHWFESRAYHFRAKIQVLFYHFRDTKTKKSCWPYRHFKFISFRKDTCMTEE